MDRAISRSLLPFDIVLYAGPLVVSVDGFGVGFLMRSSVCVAIGSSLFVLLLSILGVVLVKALCTLGYVVVITGTLTDEGAHNSVHGGGIGCVFGTLGDVCVLFSSSICVKIVVVQWGLLCGWLAHGI